MLGWLLVLALLQTAIVSLVMAVHYARIACRDLWRPTSPALEPPLAEAVVEQAGV